MRNLSMLVLMVASLLAGPGAAAAEPEDARAEFFRSDKVVRLEIEGAAVASAAK